jgi:hypothetical protein
MPIVFLEIPDFSDLAWTFKLLPNEQKDIIILSCQPIPQYTADISLRFGKIIKLSYRMRLVIFGHRYFITHLLPLKKISTPDVL